MSVGRVTCHGCVFAYKVPHADACRGCEDDPSRPHKVLTEEVTAVLVRNTGTQWPETALPPGTHTSPPVRGLRYNDGKRRFDLIPPDTLALLADLLTIGSKKYAERNWELGMPYKDAMGSLERHYQAWKSGEDTDPESGLSHMVHVMCNAMFLATWEQRGIGQDDRVKVEMPSAPATPVAR